MYTDLFMGLLNRRNALGHPVLSAMLYAFCPAAARWWQAGAEPTPPSDPVWQSLQDLTSGGTLLEHLSGYGFGNLTEEVKKYVQEVQTYRSLHPIQAPETFSLFRGGPKSRPYRALVCRTPLTSSGETGATFSFTSGLGPTCPRTGGLA